MPFLIYKVRQLEKYCIFNALRFLYITVDNTFDPSWNMYTQNHKYMKAKRQSTVEPVFGTLTQFRGLRKINTIGIKQANKVMHMSAIAYNLKKYLKFISKTVKSDAKAMHHLWTILKSHLSLQISQLATDKRGPPPPPSPQAPHITT